MKNIDKIETGKIGERLAIDYLKKQGYRIIERNYRGKLGEIDIIAKEGEYLCFIEVKTRADNEKGYPQEALTRAKMRKISQNALGYIKKNKIGDCDMRFDVVGVVMDSTGNENKIELIKDAFELPEPYF